MRSFLTGFDVDIESQQPILHGYFAGVGGPWAKYYTFRHIADAALTIKIPISGTGGAINGEDVIKYVLLGATTVQILSAIMMNGWETVDRINREIKEYMVRKEVTSLDEIRGKALQSMTHADEIIRWSGEPKSGPRNAWK